MTPVSTPAEEDASTSCRTLQQLISGDKPAFRPEDTLRSAGDLMRAHHAEAWPVVENQLLVGMVDQPNPDWVAQGHGHDPELCQVSACMKPATCRGYNDDDCKQALQFMLAQHLHHIPITDHDEHFLGIVSVDEILAALMKDGAKAPD